MVNTYTQLYIQIVFAVQGRQCLIQAKHKDEIYKYISGIISRKGQKLLQINGPRDHVHILIGMRPTTALSDLVKIIKTESSKFINEQRWVRGNFIGRKASARSRMGIPSWTM